MTIQITKKEAVIIADALAAYSRQKRRLVAVFCNQLKEGVDDDLIKLNKKFLFSTAQAAEILIDRIEVKNSL